MKKTIVISNYDDLKNPYYAGGGALAVHEVAKRLAKRHSVSVVTGKYPDSKDEVIENVNYKRIGSSFGGSKVGQLTYQISLLSEVMRTDYDIWVESFTPPISTSFLPFFTGRPVIGLVHMLTAADMQRKYKLPFTAVEKLGLRFYKNFIVMTDDVAGKITEINPDGNIEVIPNSVNIVNFAKAKEKKHILFIGRLELDQKGIDLMLDAYKKIAEVTSVPLVIAGSGDPKEENIIKKEIEKLGIEDNVLLTGRVEGKKKRALFEEAFLLVLPSRFETFSIAALEAMAYSLPVVGFDIKGTRWMPDNCCIKVESFDTTKMAENILALINNEAIREKMGQKGREYVSGYSWDDAALSYESFINCVLEGGQKLAYE